MHKIGTPSTRARNAPAALIVGTFMAVGSVVACTPVTAFVGETLVTWPKAAPSLETPAATAASAASATPGPSGEAAASPEPGASAALGASGGPAHADGREGPASVRVEPSAGRIVFDEKIQFDPSRATVRPASSALLDQIAAAIKKNPTLKKIRVEGHSSAEGDSRANKQLSEERAKSVVAGLQKRGVPRGLLVAQGFGASVPVADNTTEAGRERNRRVDFVILDPTDVPTKVNSK
jgi:outer membrane protein OmpA-like peptidoglycan-associated protein